MVIVNVCTGLLGLYALSLSPVISYDSKFPFPNKLPRCLRRGSLFAVLSIAFVFHIKNKNLLLMMFIVSAAILGALCGWIYFATMESSPAQATLGKMALSIKVVDTSCNRISFKRASGRFFGKFVSALFIFIGFVISGFSRKKQAFHDIMAHCMVIMETSP